MRELSRWGNCRESLPLSAMVHKRLVACNVISVARSGRGGAGKTPGVNLVGLCKLSNTIWLSLAVVAEVLMLVRMRSRWRPAL